MNGEAYQNEGMFPIEEVMTGIFQSPRGTTAGYKDVQVSQEVRYVYP